MPTRNIVLELAPTRARPRASEGSFIRLRSGRIVFAYTQFSSGVSDHAEAVIVTRHSDDEGRSWSARPRLLIANEGRCNVMSVSLLRLADGRIALVYVRKDSPTACVPVFRYSDDEMRSFSPPLVLAREPGFYVVNNDRLCQLANGRIVVPVALHRMRGAAEAGQEPGAPPSRLNWQGLVYFLLSDDGGAFWFESRNHLYFCDAEGQGLQEPGLIELRGNRLWAYARPCIWGLPGYRQKQWQSFSDDGGHTWSPPEPSLFVSSCSPMLLGRLRDGTLYALWNDSSGQHPPKRPQPFSCGRTPLALAFSRDEGRHWTPSRCLESEAKRGYAYPACFEPEDALLVGYRPGAPNDPSHIARLRMRRVPLSSVPF